MEENDVDDEWELSINPDFTLNSEEEERHKAIIDSARDGSQTLIDRVLNIILNYCIKFSNKSMFFLIGN